MMKRKLLFLAASILGLLSMNSSVSAQCGAGQSEITLDVDFTNDGFPDEDGWRLVNLTDGITVDSACFGTYAGQSGIVSITICADTAKMFALFAYDDFGDGLDGSEYRLSYSYGNGIDTIGSNNFNIAASLCAPSYTNNEIADSTVAFMVQYVAPPACLAPTANTGTNSLSATSAEVSWTENGTATSYRIEYDTAGYAAGTARNTSVVTDTFSIITGLMSNTDYDWNVQALCSASDSSGLVGGSFFTGYCTPAPSSVDGSGITNVSFDTVNNTTGVELGNYGDYSSLVGDIAQSTTAAVDITLSTGFTYDTQIWVDWNDDLDFADAGETVYTATAPGINPTTLNATFIVPAAAPLGQHRMRIGGGDNPVTQCYTGSWASFEDYTVNVILPPACLAPFANQPANISTDSADVSWIENGTATSYRVEWDTASYAVGTARNSMVVSNDTNFTITGLTASTSYEWAVKSLCSPTDSSTLVGNSFNTLIAGPRTLSCGANFPSSVFTEEFDNATSFTGNIAAGSGSWLYDFNTTGSGNTGPSAAHSGSHYIFFETSTGGPTSGSIVSPAIDLTVAVTAAELSFWLHAYGATTGTIDVGVSTSATGPFTNLFSNTGEIQLDELDPYTNVGVNLDAYLGQTIYVEFLYTRGTSFTGDLAIDLVEVKTCVSCAIPTNLTPLLVGLNSADVDWTENGSATLWEVSYGAAGTSAGMGIVDTTSTKPLSLIGLTSGTTYDYYVRSICGTNDTSGWSPVGSFSTSYGIPYAQTFEAFPSSNTNIASEGWLNSRGSSAPDWTANVGGTGSSATGPDFDHTLGTNAGVYVFLETSGGSLGDRDTLTSPSIIVGATQTSLTYTYWYHMAGSTMGRMEVWVEANNVWDSLTTYDSAQHASTSAAWLLGAHTLTAYAGQSITLKFIGARGSSFSGDMAIDDISIIETPNCLPPTSLTSSNATLNGIDLDWTENNSATSWEVEYGVTGFTAGTGTTVIVAAKPYSLSGLSASTAYDFYARATCLPGINSPNSFSGSFRTANGVPYNQDFEGFTNGTPNSEGWSNFKTTNPQWIADAGGTPSGGTGPLVDHTAGTASGKYIFLETSVPGVSGDADTLLSAPIMVSASQTVLELSLWYHFHGATVGSLEAWIVDSSGTANLLGSVVGQQQPLQTDPWLSTKFVAAGYQNQTVQIALVGIRGNGFTGDIAIDDVKLDIAPAAEVGITDILRPSSGCGLGADSVEVTITNFGSNSQTGFSIGYSLNGVAITPETVSGSLGAGMTMNYTFSTTAGLSAAGKYDIITYTLLAGDADASNDTLGTDVNSFANITSFPYSTGFETGSDWLAEGDASWELGTPTGFVISSAASGTQAWVTDLALPYGDGLDAYLVSPCFDFTGVANPSINLDIWYDIESQWDGAFMQATTDGGATWNTIGNTGDAINWYNDTSRVPVDNGYSTSGDSWTGDGSVSGVNGSNGWITASHELDGLGGQSSVQLRIVFASDPNTNGDGLGIDNIEIYDRDPSYAIGILNTEDATGVADSLGTIAWTSGVVVGIDLDGNNGISFTIIDDESGVQEGMNIFNFSDVSNYVVTEGDEILVHGDIIQYNGLTEFSPDSILVLSSGNAIPTPVVVTDLDETTESKYLSIPTSWVSLSTSGAFSSNVDLTNGTDTITMRIDSDTDINDSLTSSGLPIVPGDTICGLLGVGGQFDGSSPYTAGYQIFPMRWTDLTICRLSTGIESSDLASAQFELVPNPTNGLFEIKSNGFNNSTINVSVRDINGRLISSEFVSNANGNFSKSFDLNEESKGVYFITIVDGVSVINEKLIVQ
ncbi:MAG: hypothetical protein ACJARP_001375 [Vicingaceae bacterium]|jgi:hypothetical protein